MCVQTYNGYRPAINLALLPERGGNGRDRHALRRVCSMLKASRLHGSRVLFPFRAIYANSTRPFRFPGYTETILVGLSIAARIVLYCVIQQQVATFLRLLLGRLRRVCVQCLTTHVPILLNRFTTLEMGKSC